MRALLTADTPAQLTAEFKRTVDEMLARRLNDDLLKRTQDFVRSCLSLFEEEFSEISPNAPIDPRFIRGLLLRQD